MIWMWWLLPVAAYMIGSVSFAYWAGRSRGIDLREHGSKNLGATNAGRVLGGPWFAIVFSADVLKGLLPTLLASWAEGRWSVAGETTVTGLGVATGAAAIIGHVAPCWHKWVGGKAVATSLGVLIALVWKAALIAGAVWVLVWIIGRLVKMKAAAAVAPASMVAAFTAPFAHILTYTGPFDGFLNILLSLLVITAAVVVLIKHRSNFARLVKRTPQPPAP